VPNRIELPLSYSLVCVLDGIANSFDLPNPKFIDSLAGLPGVLHGFLDSLTSVIGALLNGLTGVIGALLNGLPGVIDTLANGISGIPRSFPNRFGCIFEKTACVGR
jgi:hypothetical protein